ncbi:MULTISPECIES: L-seryl-tRNA(Sec) selenium transferase [Brachybacterium]|uniref:L-seryl-tRNA(Sec) selenium transferase n=2 Tax=Brachybacterium TaxID=43668 RepID=A0A3R8QW99_9MICO|nr:MULTISPECIES: L-seryl-tRNA(Sec) selenium transferase [Brachybacterium]RRR20219.1 L-seryl-tRNA(Sec) selenium transferase [Brachybacterium paraconglomeratum]GLI32085.1 L-seryl-tRNA(Sec) selenium transferase [Brachybacterium conglomeratum]GLK03619.1 L-seryl-tRNA(Sec) selenium transferase [Brachybacterium conglomeratum]
MPQSPSGAEDPRRRIPRTDRLLALPEVVAASGAMGERVVHDLVRAAQDRARRGEIAPEDVAAAVLASLGEHSASSLRPVLNATGVIVHTNLGRAPLSAAARQAVQDAAGYTDVEFDLATGARSRRGAGARAALLAACPAAEDALVVNNGAAALLLATTALAAGREVLWSRGELVEIGAGFRLAELVASAGARVREVGTTNRTHASDYREALTAGAGGEQGAAAPGPGAAAPGPGAQPAPADESPVGAILKVHTSNYRIEGFTSEVGIAELAALAHEHGLPLIADLGSGLLRPEPALPDEPDAASALAAGADVVITSGDKLLGGPQAGILLGRREVIARLARHPLARAVRADKLALAAIEATLAGPVPPVLAALRTDPDTLRERTDALAARLGGRTVAHDGRVGGGGGAEVPLPGWAIALEEELAAELRTGDPAVVGTVQGSACLLDLRCVPAEHEDTLVGAVAAARERLRDRDNRRRPEDASAQDPAR